MPTLSTGQVSTFLGFLVTRAYIESLDIQPAELVKGHPRWNETDMPALCTAIASNMARLAVTNKAAPVKAKPTVEDDDEL